MQAYLEKPKIGSVFKPFPCARGLNTPLPVHHFTPHITVHPFNVIRHLHLNELISLKSAAEAIQTLIRRVTSHFGEPYIDACLLTQDDVGLSLVSMPSLFL
jgi:hypothetical protein